MFADKLREFGLPKKILLKSLDIDATSSGIIKMVINLNDKTFDILKITQMHRFKFSYLQYRMISDVCYAISGNDTQQHLTC